MWSSGTRRLVTALVSWYICGTEGEYPQTSAVVNTTLGSGVLGLSGVGETFTKK